MKVSRQYCAVSLLIWSVVVTGCEDPGSLDDSAASTNVSALDQAPPASALMAALYTEADSELEFGSWRCRSALTDVPVAYVFPRLEPGRGEYAALHPVDGFGATYDVIADDGASLHLSYHSNAVRESLSGISFDGPDRWVAFSTTDGALACERFEVSSAAAQVVNDERSALP